MKHAYFLSGTAMVVLGLATSQVAAQEDVERRQEVAIVPAATTLLDQITITATMAAQAVIDAFSGTSLVSGEEAARLQPVTAADLFRQVPGVRASLSGDDPSIAINIRGLQQMGRVAVTLDGARQDYWRVGHGSGSFFIEPELLKQVTVIRGPVSNASGTGAIGGVVAFETKAADDFLRAHERWAISEVTLRPAEGHQIQLGATVQRFDDVISGSRADST